MDAQALAKKGVELGLPVSLEPQTSRSGWTLGAFFGRLVEFSGGATTALLTLAFRLILEAQKRNEPVAWIGGSRSCFFPPDASRTGVDLDALIVIRLPKKECAPRVADHLVRSGGFGLVVLDLEREFHMPLSIQSRLAGLAKKHHTALLCLTEKSKDLPSLGPMVSLRLDASRSNPAEDEKVDERFTCERFTCEARILKDKRGRARWRHEELCRGPDGLC